MSDNKSITGPGTEQMIFQAQLGEATTRIMSQVLVMQRSSDLHEIIVKIFNELHHFGIKAHSVNLLELHPKQKGWSIWSASSGGVFPQKIIVPYKDISVMNILGKRLDQKEKDFGAHYFHKRQKDAFLNHVHSHFPLPSKRYAQIVEFQEMNTGLSVAENSALLVIFYQKRSFTKNEVHVIEQIAQSFDYAFTRFLDLQKAEAQAREAQIEAALEKVRSATMAMHHTSELQEVINTVGGQFRSLELDITGGAFIAINKEIDRDLYVWGSGETAEYAQRTQIPHYDRPIFTRLINHLKNGSGLLLESYSKKEKKEFLKHLFKHPPYSQTSKTHQKQVLSKEGGYARACYTSEYTSIFIINHHGREFIEADHRILQRFATVFEQAYIRFMDIQKAEAQAREAQIEAALERVRAASMAMHKTNELAKVVSALFQQLSQLNLDFYQVWINIFVIEEGYSNCWFSPVEGIIPEAYTAIVPLGPFEETSIKSWRAGEEFSYLSWKGLKEVDEIMKALTEMTGHSSFIKIQKKKRMDRLEIVDSNHKYGVMAMAKNDDITNDDRSTLKRFTKVFEQAYTRFLDLQKAETQAKEAQVEAALERVRSRTMGMQRSEELEEVIQVVYEQFVQLGIFIEHTGFIVDYKARDDMHIWLADEHGAPTEITIPYFDSPHWNSFIEAKEKGEDFFANHLNFKEKNRFYKKLFKHIPGLPEEAKKHYLTCPGLAISTVLLDDVGLYIENFSGTPYTEEENNTLMRFGKVFQQTYTRFLDLQKAEVQAKEAKIEAALERVRSASMAMHQSQDLNHVIASVFNQLKELGFEAIQCEIILFNADTQDCEIWPSNEKENILPRSYRIPYTERTFYQFFLNAWKTKTDYHPYELKGRIKSTYEKWLFTQTDWKNIPKSVQKSMQEIKRVYLYGATIKHGILEIGGHEPIPEERFEIVRRFANVFEQSYTRFLDLQKAEAQTREAQIETCLEKVRSKSLAMHDTSQLQDVVNSVNNQLNFLGLDLDGAVICIKEENKGKEVIGWVNTSLTKPRKASLPYYRGHTHTKLLQFVKDGKGLSVENYSKDTVSKWYSYLFKKPGWLDRPKEANRALLDSIKHYYRSTWASDLTTLTILRFKGLAFTESDHNILERFAKVFEQSYRRFLDLKKAEEQARIAQIEAGLERVRASAMAMHNTKDLAETVNVFFKELKTLGVQPIRCGVAEIIEESRSWSLAVTNASKQGDTYELIGEVKNLGHPILEKMYKHWESQEAFFPVLKHEEMKAYYKVLRPQIAVPKFSKRAIHYGNYFYFEEGFVFAWTDRSLTEEELHIFRRFTSVLSLTYKRYRDLKEAEAQARESQIEAALERVRSRTMAMQQSDELPEAANLLFKQVQSLGIPAWSAGYCIWENEEKKSATAFMSSEGVLQKPFSLPTAGVGYDFYDPLQRGEIFHVEELGGEEIKKHYEFMRTLPVFGEVIDGILEAGFPLPTFQIFHIVYFPQGYLMFITYEKVPNAHDIFMRFAKVFEQTYTRFLDLKQAEHQALLIRKEKNRLEKALSKLKATQTQLIHAEKMASLGELTAGIAHEIKNPLNFVNNFSEVSKELLEEMVEEMKKGDTEEAFEIIEDIKGNLQRIVEHGKRADSIVKGMLMHSRGSSTEKELTDMNALCDEYLRLAYHGLRAKDKSFNAEMETDLDGSLPKIRIAPQEIGRVMLNLITNAFHAVNERRLNLGSSDYKPVVTIKTTYRNSTIKIAVMDNGGGIPDDIKDKIFQPFFTTKPTGEGTGLGLSLSYDIVKAHGGELTVNTEINKGSNFIITLPN